MVAQSKTTGCHTAAGRRPENQDAVVSLVLPDGRELVAIADGMGGHHAGEVASQGALKAVRDGLTRGLSLHAAVAAANEAVHTAAQTVQEWAGMGTTLVALLRAGDTYEIANVGDSRAYWVTVGGIRQITTDHSVVAEAMSSGGMSVEAAQSSRWRNALTRAIGTETSVEVDLFGPFSATERHAVLLCSDGVYRAVPDDELRTIVASAPDPDSAARLLADEAYRNGSTDNISAAIVLFDSSVVTASPQPSQSLEPFTATMPTGAAPPSTNGRRRRAHSTRPRSAPALELALIVVLLVIIIALLVRGS